MEIKNLAQQTANQNVEEMKTTVISTRTSEVSSLTWVSGDNSYGSVGFGNDALIIFNSQDIPEGFPMEIDDLLEESQFYITSVLQTRRIPHTVITPDKIFIFTWDTIPEVKMPDK